MPILIPESPRFETPSEQQVWEILRDQLDDDDVLMASVRVADESKDHEADLLVLMPDHGIVVIEVKGGSVWHDGGWWIHRGRGPERIDPVAQAREAAYALRDYVRQDPDWGSRGLVAWAHCVATPASDFPDDFATPDLPRHALHAKGDLTHLVGRLRHTARKQAQGVPIAGKDAAWQTANVLQGRRTSFDPNALVEERLIQADRLTEEQANLLKVTRLIPRVEVRGGAGSGKTVMALQQAKQLSAGREGQPPQRVALLCYSLGLAAYLSRETEAWPRRQRPAFVGTFHDFGRQWGAPEGDREDSDFWEAELPRLMSDLADDLGDGHRYDAIIVDEAQDFADSWWRPVLKSLRDEEQGGLYVYSDENQRIFARFGRPPVQLVPLVLDHNLRNTAQIHDAFAPLAPSRMFARGGDGPPVTFVPTSIDDALEAADDEVERLLEEGWDPGKVCLITTGHRYPVQKERTEYHGQDGYWQTFWEEDDVFYGHVLGCKGLERPVVVLCVNDDGHRDRAKERLYVGMSRATDVLVVVGDPEVIRRVGGEDVARRLGIDEPAG